MYILGVIGLAIGLSFLVIGVGWISSWDDKIREERRGHM
jgi:hypothetical protein